MLPEQYDILVEELRIDPLERGYANMTDEQVAEDLNTAYRKLPDHALKTERAILEAADDAEDIITAIETASAQNKLLAQALVALRSYDSNGGLDFAHPRVIAVIEQLHTAGILTSAQKDAVLNLGLRAATRAEELNLPKVYPGHVTSARKLI